MVLKKIMIIDDDPDVRKTLEDILKNIGYSVVSIDDGYDFFKRLKDGEIPDLIILDVMMPVMSGWEIQRRLEINPNWNNIPIIFVTGRKTDTAREMGQKYGVFYIEKPFDINEIKICVDKALNK